MEYDKAQSIMIANMQILDMAGIRGRLALEIAASETIKVTGVDFSPLAGPPQDVVCGGCKECGDALSIDDRIVQLLDYAAPLTAAVIANRMKSNVADIGPVLRRLERDGRIKSSKTGRKYRRQPVIAWGPA